MRRRCESRVPAARPRRRHARFRRRADPLLQAPAERRQMPAIGRFRPRAAAPRHGEALQKSDSRSLLAARLLKSHHMMLMIARSEENTSELQSLMRISYAVFCLKKNNTLYNHVTISLS